jgi:hypothetical protein
MAAKAELLGVAPGSAKIRISGIVGPTAIATIQIRRNQGVDVFLGFDGEWQASPDCWHNVLASDLTVVSGRVEIAIGPILVDPIVRVQTQNVFRLSWRAGERTDTADLVLTSQHPILASGALQPSAPTNAESQDALQKPGGETSLRPIAPPNTEDRIGKVEKQQGRRGGLLVGGLLVLLLVASTGSYYWYNLERAEPDGHSASEASVPPSTREMLVGFMNDKPNAAAIVGKADEMLKSANVDAAVYLYRQGADRGDAKSALKLGLLYDPDGATVSGSKLTKSSDTAAFWYGKAADAGLAEAQRRLGNVLTKAHPVGSGEFNAGIVSLKAASKQGDADASARLKELGQ